MEESFASADASLGAPPGLEYDDIVKLPDGPDTIMLGAGSLLVDAYLRTPPVAQV